MGRYLHVGGVVAVGFDPRFVLECESSGITVVPTGGAP
jgi:hypothetical protein